MKIDNFEAKEIKKVVKEIEHKLKIVKQKESLLHKLKRLFFNR